MNKIHNSNTASMTHTNHPSTSLPRSSISIRVGVVGHRPNRLANADINQLKQVLNAILGIIKSEVLAFSKTHAHLYDPSPPILRAISPLAEGTDRLFAEQALDLGFELCCVMPFPQAEFEKDFAPGNTLESDSLASFNGLLARAETESNLTRLELPGSREHPEQAYGDAGRAVLDHSDILIVVWDGEDRGKLSGTEETFRDARNRGMPVVWVDAQAPHVWQVFAPGDSLPKGAAIKPAPHDDQKTIKALQVSIKSVFDPPDPVLPRI